MNNQELIDEIMDEFDFDRVYKTMVALNWTWHSTNGVPNISDLRKSARGLLKSAVEYDQVMVSSGGFVAYKEDGILGLRFELTDYETECE